MDKNDNRSIDIIETSEKTLDRTIGFINSCDSKASIILALIGILLTVICVEAPNHAIAAKDTIPSQLNYLFAIYIIKDLP